MEPQELRNVAYRGPLNDLIYELAEHRFLREQLKIRGVKSSAYQTMDDAELVLRFMTLQDGWREFSGDYRTDMDNFMKYNRNASDARLQELANAFTRAIEACKSIWGGHAFKRPTGQGWRDQLLTGMYDAEMVAISEVSDAALEKALRERTRAKDGTRELFDDPVFEQAVRQGTNTPSRLTYRIEKVRDLLNGFSS